MIKGFHYETRRFLNWLPIDRVSLLKLFEQINQKCKQYMFEKK